MDQHSECTQLGPLQASLCQQPRHVGQMAVPDRAGAVELAALNCGCLRLFRSVGVAPVPCVQSDQ